MVGPIYKENERLISGKGERKKEKEKADAESTVTGSWPLSDLGLSIRCRSASHR